jgi:hypothetical protein
VARNFLFSNDTRSFVAADRSGVHVTCVILACADVIELGSLMSQNKDTSDHI